MRILTLCPQCRAELEVGYSVRTYFYEKATTQPEKKCQKCHKVRTGMEMYIIDKKRK